MRFELNIKDEEVADLNKCLDTMLSGNNDVETAPATKVLVEISIRLKKYIELKSALGTPQPLWAEGIPCTTENCGHSSVTHAINGVCTADSCPCCEFKA